MIKIITGMPGHGMSLKRPSDRWSKTNKFLNAQADMFRSEHNRAVIERLADLSPEQQRRLIVAAPAFVAGEGST